MYEHVTETSLYVNEDGVFDIALASIQKHFGEVSIVNDTVYITVGAYNRSVTEWDELPVQKYLGDDQQTVNTHTIRPDFWVENYYQARRSATLSFNRNIPIEEAHELFEKVQTDLEVHGIFIKGSQSWLNATGRGNIHFGIYNDYTAALD